MIVIIVKQRAPTKEAPCVNAVILVKQTAEASHQRFKSI